MDTEKVSGILSLPIQCTITLGELLKIRPHLWNDLENTLGKLGIKEIDPIKLKQAHNKNETVKTKQTEPVPLNKVGEYCEGEDGNITIPVEHNNIKTLAILDSGAGVAIATKSIWEAWGRPAIRQT